MISICSELETRIKNMTAQFADASKRMSVDGRRAQYLEIFSEGMAIRDVINNDAEVLQADRDNKSIDKTLKVVTDVLKTIANECGQEEYHSDNGTMKARKGAVVDFQAVLQADPQGVYRNLPRIITESGKVDWSPVLNDESEKHLAEIVRANTRTVVTGWVFTRS